MASRVRERLVRAARDPHLVGRWASMHARWARRRLARGVRVAWVAIRRLARGVLRTARFIVRGLRHHVRRLGRRVLSSRWGRVLGFGPGRRIRERIEAAEHRQEGYGAYRDERFEAAAEAFERAVALEPVHDSAWLGLARSHHRLGRLDAAAEAARSALTVRPHWSKAVDLLALILTKQGRIEELRSTFAGFEPAVAETEVLRVASRRLRRAGEFEMAGRFLDELVRRDPDDIGVRAERAMLRHAAGDRESADVFLASSAPGDPARIEYLCATGRARRAFAEVDLDTLDDRQLLQTLGRGLLQQGWLRAAITVFERALELRPDDQRAQRGLRRARGELVALDGTWATPSWDDTRHVRPRAGSVLHLVGRSLPHTLSGYSIRTHNVARAQRDVGLDPVVVTQLGFPWHDGVSGAAEADTIDAITYRRVTDGDLTTPHDMAGRLERNTEMLAGVVEELRPAVLHAASDFLNAAMATELGRRFSLPVVYEARGFWEETWLSKQSYPTLAEETDRYTGRHHAELDSMCAADRVVTLAAVMRDHVIERGVDAERVVVVPNAVDPDDFVPRARDPELAEALDVSQQDVVVGYISSLVGYEGVEHLVQALGRLLDDGVPVRGLIVGDGPTRPALERAVQQGGWAERIRFTGRVPHDQVRRYYSLIDVFVIPRTRDRVCQLVTPLKPFEAMAMAKALVVSDLPALREVVDPGRTGLCVAPEDAEELAKAIERLVTSPGEREELGRAARSWVVRHRTWDRAGEAYRELYAELGAI